MNYATVYRLAYLLDDVLAAAYADGPTEQAALTDDDLAQLHEAHSIAVKMLVEMSRAHVMNRYVHDGDGNGHWEFRDRDAVVKAHTEAVLAACGGELLAAAKVLGVDYSTLWRNRKSWRSET